MDNWQIYLLFFVVVICVLPLVIGAIAVYLVLRQLRQLAKADITPLNESFQRLRAANPQSSDEVLIGRIISQQAFRCGVIGAITGLGGFVTLPIALPLDVLLSMRIQASLAEFIAAHYGNADSRVLSSLILTGGAKAAQTSSDLLVGTILRILGKSLSKFVPFVGAIAGFLVNYVFAQATGRVALQWFRNRGMAVNTTR